MNEIQQQLEEIANYLKELNITLSSEQNDGRLNSAINENEIINLIERQYNIDVPTARNWADFYINDIPVNIKITTTKTADNASSKEGLYYALTGEIYHGSNQWKAYLKQLKANIKDTNKDYYFLVVNKTNTQDIFINSLKQISKLQPNGNNLPFQIKWCDNKIMQPKTFEEAKELLLSTLGKSIKLRADAYISFQKYFSEYL
jgi:hypothetical protein